MIKCELQIAYILRVTSYELQVRNSQLALYQSTQNDGSCYQAIKMTLGIGLGAGLEVKYIFVQNKLGNYFSSLWQIEWLH